MKRKTLIYILFFLVLVGVVIASSLQGTTSLNFLTMGNGDSRYCKVRGACILDTMTVNNLTIINGSVNFANVTIINYNVTGILSIEGDIYASDFYYNDGTSLNDTYLRNDGDTGIGNYEIQGDLNVTENINADFFVGQLNGTWNESDKYVTNINMQTNLTLSNETIKDWVYNGTLSNDISVRSSIVLNISNHEQTYKHGNSTDEVWGVIDNGTLANNVAVNTAINNNASALNQTVQDWVNNQSFLKNDTEANFTELFVESGTIVLYLNLSVGLYPGNKVITTTDVVPNPLPEYTWFYYNNYYMYMTSGNSQGKFFRIIQTIDEDLGSYDGLYIGSGFNITAGDYFDVVQKKGISADFMNITGDVAIDFLRVEDTMSIDSLGIDGALSFNYFGVEPTPTVYYSEIESSDESQGKFFGVTLDVDKNVSYPPYMFDLRLILSSDLNNNLSSSTIFRGYYAVESGQSTDIGNLTIINPLLDYCGSGSVDNLIGTKVSVGSTCLDRDISNTYGILIDDLSTMPNNTWAIYSEGGTIYSGGNIELPDDVKYYTGTAQDTSWYFNGSDSVMKAEIASPIFYFEGFQDVCTTNGTCLTDIAQSFNSTQEIWDVIDNGTYANNVSITTFITERDLSANTSMKAYIDNKKFTINNTDITQTSINVTGTSYLGDNVTITPDGNITMPLGAVITVSNSTGTPTMCWGWGC